MPQFNYRAINNESQVSTGTLVAESELLLESRIADMGLWLIEASKNDNTHKKRAIAKVSRQELVDFFGGLATLIDAGIDVAEALNVLSKETEQPAFRRVLEDVRLNIESGVGVYESLSVHEQVFDSEICNLIRAGEHSGNLVEACNDISSHLEWVDQILSDIKQATIYPAMLSVAVLGLVFLMFSFVVPQFAEIFESLNLELPAMTRGVVTVGEICNNYWWLILSGAGLVYGFLRWAPDYLPGLGLFLDRLKITMPVFGPVNHLLLLSRFTHNLALLLKAGVPIVQSINLVAGVISNRLMANALSEAQQAVVDGRRMSESLAEHRIITPIVMRMIVVGEETGRLDSCLQKVSDRLDHEIPRRIKRLFSVLEPMITLLLIGIVGMVAAAIFMPLFSLMSGIRG